MKAKKNSIIIDKWTYIFLITIPVGVLKMLFFDLTFKGRSEIIVNGMVSVVMIIVGVYLFIRFNVYAAMIRSNHHNG